MTEDEREKAQEQMKALNQAYSELSQHCSDQNNSSEEVGLLEFVSIAFSFRKRRHLLFSCMTNNFPFVQRERPCCITFLFFFYLFIFFTSSRWSRAGNIQTVEKNLSVLQTCFSLPTFGL